MATKSRKMGSRSRRSAAVRDAQRPSSGWQLPNSEVERALLTGEYAPELEDLFGAADYAELRQLAGEAQKRGRRGGKKVLIVPGLMGSKLGERKADGDNVCWIGPIDVLKGRLVRIALDKSGMKAPVPPITR